MKLRNKKTGEITEWEELRIANFYTDGELKDGMSYGSLAELNKEWEDYVPKEPLIKDKKIRKVVRAWFDNLRADMCDGSITFYVDTAYCTFQTYILRNHHTRETDIAELDLVFDYDGLDDGTTYTIEELCGEEEALEPLEPKFVDLDERVKEKGGE